MDLLERNIVALFDKEFTKECIQVSRAINDHIPSAVILNTTDMLPHMTLYTTNFPTKNEKLVKEKLQEITAAMHTFSVTFTKPVIDMLGVWLNADPTPVVQQAHETYVDALNNLREGLYDAKELLAIGDNKERQESLIMYGMWAAKKLYIPHVTLSRPINSSRLEEALHTLPATTHDTTLVKEIAYVERGPYGTCKRILERFSLQ